MVTRNFYPKKESNLLARRAHLYPWLKVSESDMKEEDVSEMSQGKIVEDSEQVLQSYKVFVEKSQVIRKEPDYYIKSINGT